MFAALAADPWFEPPLTVSRDAARSGAILFENTLVTVSASVLSARAVRATPPPVAVVASGRVGVTRYVRGGATLLRWRVPPVAAQPVARDMGRAEALPTVPIADGTIVRHDGRLAAQLTVEPTRDLAMITATVRIGADPIAREYDRASGAFLRMATTDEGAARGQLLLGLLRAGGATDADTAFDAATRDRAFFLRWSAMREWLAHDRHAAWSRLCELAEADPHPDVRAAAGATVAALTRRAA